MNEFTWSGISLAFPEWKEDMLNKQYQICFPKLPKFSGERISLDLNDYGIDIILNQNIPNWISDDKTRIKKMYKDLSKKVLEEISSEFKKSLPILESWRNFIQKHDGHTWVGNLQNHLDFTQKYGKINLYDYYKFYVNSDQKNNSPIKIIKKIKNLPKDSLNEKWKKYYALTEIVGEENEITGKTLTECISNADKVYKMADELKELNFN
jgi:hypothetical protein